MLNLKKLVSTQGCVMFGAILAALLCACGVSDAEETSVKNAAARTTTKKTDSADLTRLERKVDKVLTNQETMLNNQQAMLKKFDEVMEELRIIKVRATLK